MQIVVSRLRECIRVTVQRGVRRQDDRSLFPLGCIRIGSFHKIDERRQIVCLREWDFGRSEKRLDGLFGLLLAMIGSRIVVGRVARKQALCRIKIAAGDGKPSLDLAAGRLIHGEFFLRLRRGESGKWRRDPIALLRRGCGR